MKPPNRSWALTKRTFASTEISSSLTKNESARGLVFLNQFILRMDYRGLGQRVI